MAEESGPVQPLIDVTDETIAAILASDDSTLVQSLRRLKAALDDPDGVISAFQSYTS